MFGSPILDVAIGLMFVYLLLSLIASAVREGVEAWLKSRSQQLELGIRTLLHDTEGKDLARSLYEHPLVYGLYAGGYGTKTTNLPSYIPARSFAVALLDVIARGPVTAEPSSAERSSQPVSIEGLREAVLRLENAPVRRALLSAIDLSHGSVARAQANIEAWYDSSMDRVSGWYKRETQRILLALGITVAIIANVNTFALARHLYRDRASREALVSQAATADTTSRSLSAVRTELRRLDLPIGWSHVELQVPWKAASLTAYPWWQNVLEPLFGWLMTALAISLGAPFWFDFLNKFMVIRSTVKPREKSPEEGSEDRQPRAPVAPAAVAAPAPAPTAGLARPDQMVA